MATEEEIADLRLKINEPNNVNPYTDDVLSSIIDSRGVRLSASAIWESKAAQFATLVNISESGSSRSMGDLYKNATAMATLFSTDPTVDGGRNSAPRTRDVERA